MSGEIDPVEFGSLQATVRHLDESVKQLSAEVKALTTAMNQSKGALWVLLGGAGLLGGAISAIIVKAASRLLS